MSATTHRRSRTKLDTNRSRLLLALSALLIVLLVAGCAAPVAAPAAPAASGESSEAAAAPAAGEPRQGGTLVLGSIQEPDSLNPWLTGLTVGFEVEAAVYDSLTRVDPAGQHIPLLAAEVPSTDNGGISDDLLTYTYTLRDDVTWHDGTPFTSADVVFTFEAINDPNVNARSRTGFDLVDSVEAPDDQTVVFHLKQPSAVFLETWGYKGILPKHIFEDEDLNTSDYNRAPTVGTGPYKFVEWLPGEHIKLERNPDYYREGAYLDAIDYRIIPSSDTLLALVESGELDLRFTLSAEQVEYVESLDGYQVLKTPAHAYFHFTVNNTDPILGDVRVRQALTQGLNKQAIVDTILHGLVPVQESPVAQPSWVYVDHNDRYPFDPAAAGALLEEAGWVLGADGVREKDGERLSLDLLNIAGDAERLQVVQLAQADWAQIGAEVNIDAVDAPTFVAAMTSQDYQFAYGFWGFSVDPSGYNERWLSTSAGQWLNFNNPTVDQLLLDALEISDPEERKAKYTEFQDIVVEEATNIYVYNRLNFDVVSDRVQGFVPAASSSTNFWNVNEWWLSE